MSHHAKYAACVAILWCAAAPAYAYWVTIDDFHTPGTLENPVWFQPTAIPFFYSDGDRARLVGGRGLAIVTNAPDPSTVQRVRFSAYSNSQNKAQCADLLLGYVDSDNYCQVRLAVNAPGSSQFYRMLVYYQSNGVRTLATYYDLAPNLENIQLDAAFIGTTLSMQLQSIDDSGRNVGVTISYSCPDVPVQFTQPSAIGVSALGPVQIDDLQVFVAPETRTLALMSCVSLLIVCSSRQHRSVIGRFLGITRGQVRDILKGEPA